MNLSTLLCGFIQFCVFCVELKCLRLHGRPPLVVGWQVKELRWDSAACQMTSRRPAGVSDRVCDGVCGCANAYTRPLNTDKVLGLSSSAPCPHNLTGLVPQICDIWNSGCMSLCLWDCHRFSVVKGGNTYFFVEKMLMLLMFKITS